MLITRRSLVLSAFLLHADFCLAYGNRVYKSKNKSHKLSVRFNDLNCALFFFINAFQNRIILDAGGFPYSVFAQPQPFVKVKKQCDGMHRSAAARLQAKPPYVLPLFPLPPCGFYRNRNRIWAFRIAYSPLYTEPSAIHLCVWKCFRLSSVFEDSCFYCPIEYLSNTLYFKNSINRFLTVYLTGYFYREEGVWLWCDSFRQAKFRNFL